VANPGDQYRFSFSLSDLQLFEAETGMAISA
jgi:hypothetical protein